MRQLQYLMSVSEFNWTVCTHTQHPGISIHWLASLVLLDMYAIFFFLDLLRNKFFHVSSDIENEVNNSRKHMDCKIKLSD